MIKSQKDAVLTEKEVAKRRDETLRRTFKTTPKPHSEIAGKKKPKLKKKSAK